jgi:hypothetical protein
MKDAGGGRRDIYRLIRLVGCETVAYHVILSTSKVDLPEMDTAFVSNPIRQEPTE